MVKNAAAALRSLQVGVAHQKAVNLGGAVAAFAQAPDHKALAAAHIAADEHLFYIGLEGVVCHVAACGQLNAECIGYVVFAAGKACGDERQLAVVSKFFAGGHHVGAAGLGIPPGFR